MPARAPVFRPPGWKEREPWQRKPGWKDKRKRGRIGQRERAQVLAEEPFCRVCDADGIITIATEVDHIVNLAAGGSDERSNKQALCSPHHREKTAAEAAAARRSAHRPPT